MWSKSAALKVRRMMRMRSRKKVRMRTRNIAATSVCAGNAGCNEGDADDEDVDDDDDDDDDDEVTSGAALAKGRAAGTPLRLGRLVVDAYVDRDVAIVCVTVETATCTRWLQGNRDRNRFVRKTRATGTQLSRQCKQCTATAVAAESTHLESCCSCRSCRSNTGRRAAGT